MKQSKAENILLIRPPVVEVFRFASTTPTAPLGLAYVSAALKRSGFKVQTLDAIVEGYNTRRRYIQGTLVGLSIEQIVEKITKDIALIGLTCLFTHEWPFVVALIKKIKSKHPNICIMIGGEHPSSMPEFCALTSDTDIVVRGEGEEIVCDVAAAVINKTKNLEDISGIVFKKQDASIKVNPRRARKTQIDDLAIPDWHGFDPVFYHEKRLVGSVYTPRITVPMLATRGCPYQCTFCSSPNMWTTKWVSRDPIKVVDEIEHHMNNFGATNFPFHDLTAIIKRDWIVDFCKEILRRKLDITWQLPSGTRCEVIDKEVADLLEATGMMSMAFAPESGSEETRIMVKKKMQKKSVLDAMKVSGEANLNVAVYMILGFPHDKVKHFKESEKFIIEAARSGAEDLAVGYYLALPGTQLFRSLVEAGKIKINKSYFVHLLNSQTFVPHQIFMPKASRWTLVYWKFRLTIVFYLARAKHSKSYQGFIWHLLKGFLAKKHESKLQTVMNTLSRLGWYSTTSFFRKRWISKSEESKLFQSWHEIFESIQSEISQIPNTNPENQKSEELYKTNVSRYLKELHSASFSVKNPLKVLDS